jgi:HemY protein
MGYIISIIIKLSAICGIIYLFKITNHEITLKFSEYTVVCKAWIFVSILIGFFVVWTYSIKVMIFITGLPKKIREKKEKDRKKWGYYAYTEGMVALTTGNSSLAYNKAKLAKSYIPESPLVEMLMLQVSDNNSNEEAYRLFLQENNTKPLGYYGLTRFYIKNRLFNKATDTLSEAFNIFPNSSWILEGMFQINVYLERYEEALDWLQKLSKHLDLNEYNKKASRLWTIIGITHMKKGAARESLYAHEQSNRLDPSWCISASEFALTQKKNKAIQILSNAWKNTHHPMIISTCNKIFDLESEREQAISVITNNNKNIQEFVWTCCLCANVFKEWKYICNKCESIDSISAKSVA